jgi:hypothetical protein
VTGGGEAGNPAAGLAGGAEHEDGSSCHGLQPTALASDDPSS